MIKKLNSKKCELIEKIKMLCPVVMDPTLTQDMGIECTIVTKDGIVNPVPGMFLFCGGYWPISIIPSLLEEFMNEQTTYSLYSNTDEESTYTDITELEEDFFSMFVLDFCWEEMSDSDLTNWYEGILSEGMSIVELTKISTEEELTFLQNTCED